MTPALGLVVLGCLAAVFAAGVFTGRTIASRRYVDRLLQRELRFRDPPRADVLTSAHDLEEQLAPMPTDLIGDGYGSRSVYVADGTKLGITAGEAMAGAKGLSGALRADRRSRSVDVATQFLVDRARDNGKCGAPVTTSLGPMPCLRRPGHTGLCG
jgi:hypothetical protein